MKSIEEMRDSGDFQGLRETLLLGKNSEVRYSAARALRVLFSAMAGDGTPWGRALATTPVPTGREGFFTEMIGSVVLHAGDKDERLRLECLQILGDMAKRGGFWGVDGLRRQTYLESRLNALVKDESEPVREAAEKLKEVLAG